MPLVQSGYSTIIGCIPDDKKLLFERIVTIICYMIIKHSVLGLHFYEIHLSKDVSLSV
jgi:hypothetical protein